MANGETLYQDVYSEMANGGALFRDAYCAESYWVLSRVLIIAEAFSIHSSYSSSAADA